LATALTRLEQEDRYDDGVFRVGRKYGFLPQRSPLKSLPSPFEPVQNLLNELPVWLDDEQTIAGILGQKGRIVSCVEGLKNFSSEVSEIVDMLQSGGTQYRDLARLTQSLFRAYSFLASSYLLESSYHETGAGGMYGRARNRLPATLAQPLVLAADALGISPWLDYHHAYSLGNFVFRDATLHGEDLWHWTNLEWPAASVARAMKWASSCCMFRSINTRLHYLVRCRIYYEMQAIRAWPKIRLVRGSDCCARLST